MKALIKNSLILVALSILTTSCGSDVAQKQMEYSYKCVNPDTRTCVSDNEYIRCDSEMVAHLVKCKGDRMCIMNNGVAGCYDDHVPECGNGIIDKDEECDGNDFGGKSSCTDASSDLEGNLKCTDDCKLDMSGCKPKPVCGNGIVEEGEDCEKDKIKVTCDSIGKKGTVLCTNCKHDYSKCYTPENLCGNGKIDEGEACDGENLNGKTCEDVKPGSQGRLWCKSDCSAIEGNCAVRPDDVPETCEWEMGRWGGQVICASDNNIWKCNGEGSYEIMMSCGSREPAMACFICDDEQRLGCFDPAAETKEERCVKHQFCKEDECNGNQMAFCVEGKYSYATCPDNNVCIKCSDGKVGCVPPDDTGESFCKNHEDKCTESKCLSDGAIQLCKDGTILPMACSAGEQCVQCNDGKIGCAVSKEEFCKDEVTYCPTKAGETCDKSCTPVCSDDNSHGYSCGDNNKTVERSCANNQCAVKNGKLDCPEVESESCVPSTFKKRCKGDRIVYCGKAKVVASTTCMQCMVNPETNDYCCNGDNEKCL